MGDSTLNVCAASAPHSEMEFVSNPAVVQHAEQRDASAHLLVLQMQHQQAAAMTSGSVMTWVFNNTVRNPSNFTRTKNITPEHLP